MNWLNVRLILGREIRDQLRDRRTLFMIVVLPMLLYPLLGMSFFQVTQFMREHPNSVLVVGAPDSSELPPLIEKDRFAPGLFDDPHTMNLLQLTQQPAVTAGNPMANPLDQARHDMLAGNYDVVVFFPSNFAQEFARLHASLIKSEDATARADIKLPSVELFPNMAKDASRTAYRRVSDVLDRWREEIGRRNLQDSNIPLSAAKPFEIATRDVAEVGQHKAAAWSKILPFVLLIWALTGAFYPAIDLCAGEKERGTLETLLSSPAERIEIVWGKLLTVMLFSMITAVLNLASMAVSGSFILSQLPNLGPPPGMAIIWLLIALVPVSALFSALCLALASFARSSKEGQYYLMPLVLVTMPLTILPMAPGVELNLGNSLIPVTGVVLLLRTMLEGNYLAALPYLPLVVAVTLCCCWLAIRWATSQFNTESVLFRESERWDVNLWVKHLLRDREPTPSFAEALFCGVLILLIRFFMNFALPTPGTFRDFAVLICVTQLVVILSPSLIMTVMLTSSPVQTLLLKRPPLTASLAALLLAVTLHPAVNLLQSLVMRVYPISEQMADLLKQIKLDDGNLWISLLVIAVVPAICEELAFRGFILSGFRHLGRKWTAIILSSIFFGATHAIFQQSLVACLVGSLIAFIAIQSGSVLPGILFHIVHNSMALIVSRLTPLLSDRDHWLHWLIKDAEGDSSFFQWPIILLSLLASGAILYWFHKLPYARTAEESLQEAIDHQSAQWMPG